ncbi:DUF4232 domain-containing protein [Amycolatopsis sp. H20-H5]|uniref:DUF4232 domain-containing protein n=1 Tax=Amycolatopsis sp. H20-H5 TaxID=3046309 RepID=UPI002DBEAFE3|nr:DUF4232 domain-containing protein [Amycolatopsis sp. H20-H5]MEC3982617.1 DUF4232 domain-containing protein [Amycolatopsis sp. H20-H5]
MAIMTKHQAFAKTALVAAVLGTGALLAACGSSDTAAPAAASPSTSASALSPSPASSASPSPSSSGAAERADTPGGDGSCKAAELKITMTPGDGAGAGSSFPGMQFTNTGKRTCTLQGSPGVSFVTGDNGQQVGKPADRQAKSEGKLVSLAPGKSAVSSLKIANAGNFGPECKPVDARGLRVYAPGDTAAMFVSYPQQACSSTSSGQLSVQVVK